MLDYEEELKKFKPCLTVDEVEETIYGKDMIDVLDILKELQLKNKKPADEGAKIK